MDNRQPLSPDMDGIDDIKGRAILSTDTSGGAIRTDIRNIVSSKKENKSDALGESTSASDSLFASIFLKVMLVANFLTPLFFEATGWWLLFMFLIVLYILLHSGVLYCLERKGDKTIGILKWYALATVNTLSGSLIGFLINSVANGGNIVFCGDGGCLPSPVNGPLELIVGMLGPALFCQFYLFIFPLMALNSFIGDKIMSSIRKK